MFRMNYQLSAAAVVGGVALAWSGLTAHAHRRDVQEAGRVKTVFVIAMENHNWTQPDPTSSPQQIFMNPDAPFVNSLVDGTSGISGQVAYATRYVNAAAGDHPSEPNYVWAEAGQNFGIANDDNPYHNDCTPDTVQTTDLHLSAFLAKAGRSWRSYQEDTDVDLGTNRPLPPASWTVPLFSVSGVFTGAGLNAYNYSNQFNYASKHNPTVFFTDTNGGCNTTTSNPMRRHYAPLQQLAVDLQSGAVADYNWITPNQYNDMHTRLTNGYGGSAGAPAHDDRASIAQGDNFLARIVPLIMASKAYEEHGVIVLWWDESEGGDTSDYTLPFIVISKEVHPNEHGVPFASSTEYSHSSTLRTMQQIFHVDPPAGYPWLGGAATADDLSALFSAGVVR